VSGTATALSIADACHRCDVDASGGGTLLICVHQFTVAFGARALTLDSERLFRSYARFAHAPCRRCTLLARGGDRTGRTQLSTRPVYTRLPDVEARVGAARRPPDTARGGAAQAGTAVKSTPSRKRNDRPLY
jgi:hypothetical protein